MRGGAPTDCFLEGPSFDRDGNLFVCDIPFGRIFRVGRDGVFSLVAEYDGEPCGLKFRKDGFAVITDFRRGLMLLNPADGAVEPLVERFLLQRFRGVNDLVFADNGDFTLPIQAKAACMIRREGCFAFAQKAPLRWSSPTSPVRTGSC